MARSSPFARHLVVEGGQLGLTLAYAAALGLAYLGARGFAIRFLAPLGRMALTWYLFQTVLGIWLFYGFPRGPGLMGKVGPASLTALCLIGYPVQVLLARALARSIFDSGRRNGCGDASRTGRRSLSGRRAARSNRARPSFPEAEDSPLLAPSPPPMRGIAVLARGPASGKRGP